MHIGIISKKQALKYLEQGLLVRALVKIRGSYKILTFIGSKNRGKLESFGSVMPENWEAREEFFLKYEDALNFIKTLKGE